MANDTTSSSNVTCNPFDAESLDSLHLPTFSPSVFNSRKRTPSSSRKKPFRWSIDHLATLYPADIDELPQQEESHLDNENEEKVQEAIDQFFSQESIAPSPWSLPHPMKSVTFSPKPPSVSSFPGSEGYSPYIPCREDPSPVQHVETKLDACCQTAITIPMNFDLESLLAGKLQPYHEDIDLDADEAIQSSSLRRKLFSFSDSSHSPSVDPSLSDDRMERSGNIHPPQRIPSPTVSPIQSDEEDDAHMEQKPKTPSSVESQFSSSPIHTSRHLTPYTPREPSPILSNGGLPPLSPICKHHDTPKTGKLDGKTSTLASLRVKLNDSFKTSQQVPEQTGPSNPVEKEAVDNICTLYSCSDSNSSSMSVGEKGFCESSQESKMEQSRMEVSKKAPEALSMLDEMNDCGPLAESSVLFGDMDCNSAAYKLTSTMRFGEVPCMNDLTFNLTMNDPNLTAMETSSLLSCDRQSGVFFPLTSTQRSIRRDGDSLVNIGTSEVIGQRSEIGHCSQDIGQQGLESNESTSSNDRPESGYNSKSVPSISVSDVEVKLCTWNS